MLGQGHPLQLRVPATTYVMHDHACQQVLCMCAEPAQAVQGQHAQLASPERPATVLLQCYDDDDHSAAA